MTDDDSYVIEGKLPSAEEQYTLRKEAGLTPPPRPDNEVALRNSWYGVTVRQDGQAVGMGRIVGDGAMFLVIVDMCILPTHQRKGLGGQIMKKLLEYVDANAPNAYLSLMADPPGVGLYEKFGFRGTHEKGMVRSTFFKVRQEGAKRG